MNKEKIICAAIWFDDGEFHEHQPKNIQTGFVICGMRHHNCFMTLAILIGDHARLEYKERKQGFITTNNQFVDRNEAARIALSAGQIATFLDNDKWTDVDWDTVQLFSEDIY